ncbi:agl cluster protein AglQ [Natronomonas salsuginis]|uniref:Agl cluster protein AglQ n=1 Tax=Natronomonas salsuginis TaxID=2217661 RepID=A0A4U5J8N2_9EURY|nr:agl cluster protein AglQ [Natronomonas salsuginis]TKR25460.1 agl cluster protein AglQ [Natronomonas salsuginis]
MKLCDYIRVVADNAVSQQRSDGSFPPGCNGPHQDSETPVRNTSHYLVLLCELYLQTEDEAYLNSANSAAAYLSSKEARPYGYTFHHRDSNVKDHCNGLIGQAWTIEAIAKYSNIVDCPELIKTAEEVFLQHPFDDRLGLWKRVEINGKVLCFDSTFNHQLWFASAGALLSTSNDVDPEINKRISHFLDKIESQINIDNRGLIELGAQPPKKMWPYIAIADQRARMTLVLLAVRIPMRDSDLFRELFIKLTPFSRLPATSKVAREKKIGYQSFHLYGFALLKKVYPDHKLWSTSWIDRIFTAIESDTFVDELEDTIYGYPYNVSGIELAYALDEFDRGTKLDQEQWLSRQFKKCWDNEKETFARNNPDPETLTARLYEAARLSDWDIEISLEDK